MHVAQLFNSLLLGVNVEIVVAALPKRSLSTLHGNRELESLQCSGESSVAWLTDQKMHVLGHDHVADNEEAIAQTDGFKRALKKLALRTKLKICQPPIAGESHEMQVTSLLIPYQSLRHKRQSYDPSHISSRYGTPKFRCRPPVPIIQRPDNPCSLRREVGGFPHLRIEMWGTRLIEFFCKL